MRKQRVIALLLTLIMVLGLVPAGAVTAGNDMTVQFTYAKGNALFMSPTKLRVTAGLANSYGIGEKTTEPTVLDAVVAAHKIKYGDEFTSETASAFLNEGLTQLFGDSGFGGHIINGHYSSDLASAAALSNGDVVDTFLYDSSYGDYYAAFYQNNSMVREISCDVGQEVSLSVQGFGVMNAYLGETWIPLADLKIGTIDQQGVFTDLNINSAENGSFSVSFSREGTYVLTTKGASGSTPIVPAWCEVTVAAAMTEEAARAKIAQDKDALTIPASAEGNLSLPKKGHSGSTSIAWQTSNPAVISAEGRVTRGLTAENVTLTASISCGAYTDTKSFPVAVPALDEAGVKARLEDAKKALTTLSLSPVEYSGKSGGSYPYEGSAAVDTNLLEKAQGVLAQAAPGVQVAFPVEFQGNDAIAKDGTIRYGIKDQSIDLSFLLTLGTEAPLSLTVTSIQIAKHAETKAEAIAKEMPKVTEEIVLNGQGKNDVTSSLKLPVGSTFGIAVRWESNHPAITIEKGTSSKTGQLHKVTRPAFGQQAATVTLTATFDYAEMNQQYGICEAGAMPPLAERQKTFVLTVPAYTEDEWNALKQEAGNKLLKNIVAGYDAKDATWWGTNATFWHAVGMKSYAEYMGVSNPVAADAKQSFVNTQIEAVVSASGQTAADANKLAAAINGFSALGYDPTQLETVNHTKLNAVARLKGISIEEAKKGWYSTVAPYVLAALNQGNYSSEAQETAHVNYLLTELQNANWSWGVDTPCMMLQGLIPYYDRAEVKAAVDAAILTLAEKQGENGSFGNANGDAMAIIALSMLGINPDTDSRFVKNNKSLLDGLLSYQTAEKNGFGFANTTYNEMATYQGFVALSSALQVMNTGKAYNPYDATALPKVAAKATGSTTPNVPSEPSGSQTITVYFTLKTQNETWIPQTSATLKDDATVYHAFTQVLDAKNFKYVGAANNYVSSITHANGTTLAEFDGGKSSGWLYKVNGALPDVGLCDKTLSNGDSIVFYYTTDWTKDPDAGSVGGSNAGNTAAEKPSVDASGNASISVAKPAKTDATGTASATIDRAELAEAVQKLTQAAGNVGGKKEVTLEIKASGSARCVETTLPSAALAAVNGKVDALTLKTGVADLSLDSKALQGITAAAGSKGVCISAEKLDPKTLPQETQAQIGNHPVFSFQIKSGSQSITTFDGKIKVELPYTPGADEDTKKLTAYYIAENGEVKAMAGARYDAEAKSMVFETDHFSTFAVAYDANKLSFADVSPTAWYAEAVSFVFSQNLFQGISETAFAPNEKMTRAMFFTVLHRMSEDKTVTGGALWYEDGMNWSKKNGISDGTNPDEGVTREMLVTMLWRYSGSPTLAENKGLQGFSDADAVSDWAVTAMAWANEKKVVQGTTESTLSPKQGATRAEVATILMRFLRLQ